MFDDRCVAFPTHVFYWHSTPITIRWSIAAEGTCIDGGFAAHGGRTRPLAYRAGHGDPRECSLG